MFRVYKEHIFENNIELKYCGKCSNYLELILFRKCKSNWDGLACNCTPCNKKDYKENKEKILQKCQEYRQKHLGEDDNTISKEQYKKYRDRILKYQKNYYQEHKDKILARTSTYSKAHPEQGRSYRKKHPEVGVLSSKKFRKNCPDLAREIGRRAAKKYYFSVKSDPMVKLNRAMSGGMWRSLKKNKNGCHWEDLAPGYTQFDLREYLENLFENWMDWTNQGNRIGCWEIDHIKPIAAFNITSAECEDFKECWALSNLRPLAWKENRDKSSWYEGVRYKNDKLPK